MEAPVRPKAGGRLAIIAGSGRLPHDVAEAARAAGEDPVVILLKSEVDRDWDGFQTVAIGTGDLAGLQKAVRTHGIGRVVMSGGVKTRPPLSEIRTSWRQLWRIPSMLAILRQAGDDKVLRMVIRLVEDLGCRVVGAQDIAPDLLAETGALTRAVPSAADRHDIRRGGAAAHALGRLDVGQGVVCIAGRIVALEGVEGTDAMLERVRMLRREGRISARHPGVLAKFCKPQQDLRADLPSIGPSTVKNAEAAGLAGIAIEAGRSLVLDRAEAVRLADEAGLFIVGIDPADAAVS